MYDVLLVDGKHVLWRSIDVFSDLSVEQDGDARKTGAIFGFLNIVTRAKAQHMSRSGYVVVCWEGGRNLHRRFLYPDYKRNRRGSEIPLDRIELIESMREQGETLQKLLAGINVPQGHATGWEADDVMGTLAERWKKMGAKIGVFTGDRDLLQVVDENVHVIRPGKQGAFSIETPATVKQEYGVTPQGFLFMKTLAGDGGDGIPGVRGVGMGMAGKVVRAMEAEGLPLTQENLIAAARRILPARVHDGLKDPVVIDLWYELCRIRRDVKVKFQPTTDWDGKKLESVLREMKFRSWLQPTRLRQLFELKGGEV